jgi:hypothetical protein
MSLKQTIRLLPSPRANDGIRPRVSTASEGWGKPLEQVTTELPKLLPTPTTRDAANARNATANRSPGSRGHSGTTLADVAYLWSGASTDPPSDGGRPSTDLRLSPWFVEWMMGLPDGWSDPDCALSATEFKSRQENLRDGGS